MQRVSLVALAALVSSSAADQLAPYVVDETLATSLQFDDELFTGARQSAKDENVCSSDSISKLKEQPLHLVKKYLHMGLGNSQFTDHQFYYNMQVFSRESYKKKVNWSAIKSFQAKIKKQSYYYDRLSKRYPQATLFGSKGVHWTDANQGQTATCYVIAGMASVAEFPQVIKRIFHNDQLDKQGFYAVNLFVRGRPWTVIVDDIFLFNSNRDLKAAKIGDDGSLWAPILEKAWAKLVGDYKKADFGYLRNGIRVFTGAPVTSHTLSAQQSRHKQEAIFQHIHDANLQNFIIMTQTAGTSDSKMNRFGVPEAHAYSIISAFTLKDKQGNVLHKLYMVRNPWSTSEYRGSWHAGDRKWHEADFLQQVPHGVNPLTSERDGIFFVDHQQFNHVFEAYQIGHLRPTYDISWYDQLNDDGSAKTYYFEVDGSTNDDQNDALYVSAESYYWKMHDCDDKPSVKITLYKDGRKVNREHYYENGHRTVIVTRDDTVDGSLRGSYAIVVEYDWAGHEHRDYTVRVYWKDAVQVVDQHGRTNQMTDGVFIEKNQEAAQQRSSFNDTMQFIKSKLAQIGSYLNHDGK